ncbi:MAG: iron ABC transporter permease [Proteobacteria bacterium]|nr:iron ABC transporter permease [Pseudomonadota bacterium]
MTAAKLAAAFVVCALGAIWLGADIPSPGALLHAVTHPQEPFSVLLLSWRAPRVLAAFCVGACLGLAGAVFQGVFRNPLAEPYLLGSAGGAAVGATIAILLPLPLAQAVALPLFAFAGAWGATILVVLTARLAGVGEASGLLLAGIGVAAVLAALRSLLLLALSDETVSLQVVLSWTLGGIQTPFWDELAVLAGLTAAGLVLCLGLASGLDVLGLGDAVAANMGLPVERFLRRAVLLAAAVTAVAVCWGGLVAFVGLVVPHVMRWRFGAAHRQLLPASAFAGGCLLMLLDGAARALLPPAEIPLGLITALLGGPFFLLLLAREARR